MPSWVHNRPEQKKNCNFGKRYNCFAPARGGSFRRGSSPCICSDSRFHRHSSGAQRCQRRPLCLVRRPGTGTGGRSVGCVEPLIYGPPECAVGDGGAPKFESTRFGRPWPHHVAAHDHHRRGADGQVLSVAYRSHERPGDGVEAEPALQGGAAAWQNLSE